MQCVAFCCLLWLFNPACHLDVVALRTNLASFFFSCLMIYKRSTQNTNLYTWNNNHSTRW
ncbi:unnamed protein product [Brassica oleracea var. botrytis]